MKLFIEEIEENILNILMNESKIIEVHSVEKNKVSLNSIYVGKVYKIKNSINSAFLKIAGNIDVYMPIRENDKYLYVNNSNGKDKLCQSDEILVQIIKYGSGEKLCTASSFFNLKSDNFVLVNDKVGTYVSKKINSKEIKNLMKKVLKDYREYELGIIARTSALDVDVENLELELKTLIEKYVNILNKINTFPSNVCVYRADREDIIIKELRRKYDFEILTKNEELARNFNDVQLLNDERFEDMMRIYGVKDKLQRLLYKKYLLKSGANIVIQKTEAMYVIDVNSHKSSLSKNNEKAVYKTNLEAAKEICAQIIARNLSGIIIVDFINMNNPELEKDLIENMRQFSLDTGAKLLIHGLTKLSLMEISRKKTGLDIYEDEVVRAFLSK